VGILVAIGWVLFISLVEGLIGLRSRYFHGRVRPLVPVRKRDVNIFVCAIVVLKPVVYLELDPGSCEEVDDSGRFKLAGLASEETVTDESWVGI
jgi:hypothetical protein